MAESVASLAQEEDHKMRNLEDWIIKWQNLNAARILSTAGVQYVYAKAMNNVLTMVLHGPFSIHSVLYIENGHILRTNLLRNNVPY